MKSYKIINLLNCIGKVLVKVMAKQLSQMLENFLKLYQSQKKAWIEKYAIYAIASLVYKIEQRYTKRKLVEALFTNVKGALIISQNLN